MADGNKYAAGVTSLGDKDVRLIIRETFQDPSNYGKVSFPTAAKSTDLRPYTKGTLVREEMELEEDLEDDEEDEEIEDLDRVLPPSRLPMRPSRRSRTSSTSPSAGARAPRALRALGEGGASEVAFPDGCPSARLTRRRGRQPRLRAPGAGAPSVLRRASRRTRPG